MLRYAVVCYAMLYDAVAAAVVVLSCELLCTYRSLLLQLQMTGYMLRNAQYVLALRRLLGITGRTGDEFRAAFDSVDIDGSGTLNELEFKQWHREVRVCGATDAI